MAGLVMVGLSHHAAPVAIRECAAFDEATWRQHAPRTLATVKLSTCNRVEIYAWTDGRPATATRTLERALARAAALTPNDLRPYLRTFTGHAALLHLVRVASGLDSLVVGEEQIRGQVRDALRSAETSGPLPANLRGVFQRAGESARRVHGGTRLGKVPSIASAGVNVAARAVPAGLHGELAVILGAGVMARAAAEALLSHGARVRLLNRTPSHAAELVARLGHGVQSGSLNELSDALAEATLVIGTTASRTPVVNDTVVRAALEQRHGRQLLLLDIALPRDVDAGVRDLPHVTLLDLDDLERLCPVDAGTRRAEHDAAEALASVEAERLAEWLRHREVSPAIAELRTYAEAIRTHELRRSAQRLRDLTPEQRAAVDALTAGIVNKLMHGPTLALRDAAARPGGLGRSRASILRVLRSSRRKGRPDHAA